jgi:REP element-mobilizing transposase RayT
MNKQRGHRIIAHHLILSSYGFWLSNDLRGSGSTEIRQPKFEDLGPFHHGRKRLQPTREELRAFYAKAFPLLEHPPLWFNTAARRIIADAFADVIKRCKYTVWACSIGSNHAHLCVRYHRDTYEKIWENLTAQARTLLIAHDIATYPHPAWVQRPYSAFRHTPDDVWRTIPYIDENPEKEGLLPQRYDFVQPYDGWPVRKM